MDDVGMKGLKKLWRDCQCVEGAWYRVPPHLAMLGRKRKMRPWLLWRSVGSAEGFLAFPRSTQWGTLEHEPHKHGRCGVNANGWLVLTRSPLTLMCDDLERAAKFSCIEPCDAYAAAIDEFMQQWNPRDEPADEGE